MEDSWDFQDMASTTDAVVAWESIETQVPLDIGSTDQVSQGALIDAEISFTHSII